MQVDRELASQLTGAGDRRIADLARKIGYRLDPGAILRRNYRAEADRRVTIRPAPDTMSNVTGLLPVARPFDDPPAPQQFDLGLRTLRAAQLLQH